MQRREEREIHTQRHVAARSLEVFEGQATKRSKAACTNTSTTSALAEETQREVLHAPCAPCPSGYEVRARHGGWSVGGGRGTWLW